jgi:hypothetical protein
VMDKCEYVILCIIMWNIDECDRMLEFGVWEREARVWIGMFLRNKGG